MSEDPFAPENDPYLDGVTLPEESTSSDEGAVSRAGEKLQEVKVELTRRQFAELLLCTSLSVPVGGCTLHRLACRKQEDSKTRCKHQFCRYYRGPDGL